MASEELRRRRNTTGAKKVKEGLGFRRESIVARERAPDGEDYTVQNKDRVARYVKLHILISIRKFIHYTTCTLKT